MPVISREDIWQKFIKMDDWPLPLPDYNPADYHVWDSLAGYLIRCIVVGEKFTERELREHISQCWEDAREDNWLVEKETESSMRRTGRNISNNSRCDYETIQTDVIGNNVPRNKCPGNKRSYCNDLNQRSLDSVAIMHRLRTL
jgi:hypothetical protein